MEEANSLVSIACPQCSNEIKETPAKLDELGTFGCATCTAVLEFDLKEYLRREVAAKSGAVDLKQYLVVRLVGGKWDKPRVVR